MAMNEEYGPETTVGMIVGGIGVEVEYTLNIRNEEWAALRPVILRHVVDGLASVRASDAALIAKLVEALKEARPLVSVALDLAWSEHQEEEITAVLIKVTAALRAAKEAGHG